MEWEGKREIELCNVKRRVGKPSASNKYREAKTRMCKANYSLIKGKKKYKILANVSLKSL